MGDDNKYRVGFIGAGKVGFSLGKYFQEGGNLITGYFSRTYEHAENAADFTSSIAYESMYDLIDSSEIIFITVPDGNIQDVWTSICDKYKPSEKHKETILKDKLICHTSGAMTSDIFQGIEDTGSYGFSIHPLFPVNDKYSSYKDMSKSYFTIEGNRNKINKMVQFIESLGNQVRTINKDQKNKYHAAAVFVSNLVVGLAQAGQDLFEECGLDKDFADNAWKELLLANSINLYEKGTVDALTGPVERNDIETVKNHLNSLRRRERTVYCELSRMILDIARDKNPERDYTNLEKELTNEEHYNNTEEAEG